MTSPPVSLVSKPKPKVKFLYLLQLKEAFSNLSQATIISMHQARLYGAVVSVPQEYLKWQHMGPLDGRS